MDAGSAPLHDPDLDFPRRAPATIPAEHLRVHQRLVVDPLLSILGCVVAGLLIRHALETRNLPLFVAAVGLLAVSLPLFRFHCRDCGVAGWFLKARFHACESIVHRYRLGEPGHALVGVGTQLFIWIYALITLVVVASIFALGRL